jgi:O-antigen/teichoic acid export membrane protein
VRVQRAIASYISALTAGGLTVVFALVATPLRLAWLGQDAMGLYRVLLDTLAYLALLEFGIATALSSLFATALAANARTRVRALLGLGVRELAKVSALKVVAGLGLTLGLALVVDIPSGLAVDFGIACGVGLLTVIVTPVNAFRALLEGGQRGYSVQLVMMLQATLSTLLAVWFAYLGWGVTGQLAALAASTFACQGLLLGYSIRRFPETVGAVTNGKERDHTLKPELRRLNRPAFVLQLSGTIAILSDSIIIATVLSPGLVVNFFLTQRLAAVAQAQLQNIGTASWAAMADIHATGEYAKFNRRTLELTSLVMVASLTALIPIAAFNRTFVTLWVGPEFYGGTVVTVAAALVALGQAVVSLWGWLFHATGQPGRLVPVSVAIVVVNLSASIILARVYGIAGPLLGTLISQVLVSAWGFPLLLRGTFGIQMAPLAGVLARPMAVGMPVSGLAWWMAGQPFFQSWVGWMVGMSSIAAGYLLLAWLFVFGAEERLAWRVRVSQVIAGVTR